jgi:hypothetical protein
MQTQAKRSLGLHARRGIVEHALELRDALVLVRRRRLAASHDEQAQSWQESVHGIVSG